MKAESRFTKNNTLAVKGIAISFLLFYHCFSQASRMGGGASVDFTPLSREAAMMISRCMVQCVGLFAFLSVYGLTRSVKKKYQSFEFSGREGTLLVLERYLHLVLFFTVPFFFCMGVTFLTDTSSYAKGLVSTLVSIVMDFFCVGHLFGTQVLISTWWYLSLEVLLIVFLPFVLRFYRKYSWLIVLMFLIPGSFLIEKNIHLTKYLFVMPLAVCFADQDVLERIRDFMIVRNKWLNKLIKFMIETIIMCALFIFWYSAWGREHFEFVLNGLIPVSVICWSYEFLIDLPVIREILQFMGKHSANVFYIHSFIRAKWIGNFVYSFGHAFLIWLVLMASSIVISIFLEGIKKAVRFERLSGKISDGIIGWADRALWCVSRNDV